MKNRKIERLLLQKINAMPETDMTLPLTAPSSPAMNKPLRYAVTRWTAIAASFAVLLGIGALAWRFTASQPTAPDIPVFASGEDPDNISASAFSSATPSTPAATPDVTPTISPSVTGLPPEYITILGIEYSTDLTELQIGGTEDTRAELNNETLSVLRYMTNLETLWIRWTEFSDLTILANLDNLVEVNLLDCGIEDIAPLSTLTKLECLCLGYNRLEDISALSSIKSLRSLLLYNNNITDISPLQNLTGLTTLSLSDNPIADGDISALSGLINMNSLELSNINIEDITPLEALTKIAFLNLQGNFIADISPLRNMTNLLDIRLSGNQITDITVLKSIKALESVTIIDNLISSDQLVQLQAALPKCIFWHGYWGDWENAREDYLSLQQLLDFYESFDTLITVKSAFSKIGYALHYALPEEDYQFFGMQFNVRNGDKIEQYELRENYSDGTFELISLLPTEEGSYYADFNIIDSKPLSKNATWESMYDLYVSR